MNCSEEERVQCYIHYVANTTTKKQLKHEVTFPGSTSVKDLFDNVALNMHFVPDSFQLVLQTTAGDKIFKDSTPGSLKNAGFNLGKRNALILEGIGGGPKSTDDTLEEDNSAGGGRLITYPFSIPQPPPLLADRTEFTFSVPHNRHNTGYVGLVNQAMTCYLNSLLQALYMTPEFRNALYIWKFDGMTKQNICIPLQLQKLFLNLQTSSRPAVETTELTRSFGWVSGEVWQQQDIQELCRVMFDALENEFKDTEQADLINRLYQGKMMDYVRCLECKKEKFREDTFLDIPLPVRPFGSAVAYGSITEALTAFVQPETLEGNDQYFCEECNKKCNAHKGLKFTKFPYLLTLHLKRFDFDYSSMNRIKLNDKVTFPEVLDLNDFIKNIDEPEEGIERIDTTIKYNDSSRDSDPALDQEEDEGIDLSSNCVNNQEIDRNDQEGKVNGPFLYDLYSIMIHSGSASGGHYYAYIKDFSKGEWYCFNDQSVTSITFEDIEKTFGGGPTRGYYSGAYSSSTNAYMLMYRQVDEEKNCFAMTEENFPPHIKETLEEIKLEEEQDRAIRARLEDMIKLKVFSINPLNGNMSEEKIPIFNTDSLADATGLAYNKLNLELYVPREQCRLVFFNRDTDQIEMSLDEHSNSSLNTILKLKQRSNPDFFLEFRDKNKTFMKYCPDDIIMTVYVTDIEKGEVQSTHHLRTSPSQTLSELKMFFCKAIGLESTDLHVILAKAQIMYLSGENKNLPALGFFSPKDSFTRSTIRSFQAHINKVFITPRGPEGDLAQNFESTQLFKVITQLHHVISLNFVIPTTCEDTEKLRSLLIPPLKETAEIEKPAEQTQSESGLPTINNGTEEEAVFGGTSDQSTSEDSSLTDSERTIIGEVQNDSQLSSASDSEQLSSPEVHPASRAYELNGQAEECWDEISTKNLYFRATPYNSDSDSVLCQFKLLRVVVDIRMDMTSLKSKVEKFVGVSGKYLKLTRGITNGSGNGLTSLHDCRDEDKITISLHRVLEDNEIKAQIYRLNLNSPNQIQFILDWILTLGTTVGATKKAMLIELERRNDLKIPYDRFRLRKKSLDSPGKVLLDNEIWDENLCEVRNSIELFVQALDKPDEVTAENNLVLFTRRWFPATLSIGPLIEVVLDTPSVPKFKEKLSEISNIPIEHVAFTTGAVTFQDEIQPLLVNKLNWEQDENDWVSQHVPDDDTVVFYRDVREETKMLSKEEQMKANTLENSTFPNRTFINNYSPRKERALKIYRNTTTPRPPTRSAIDVD